jgi:AAA domain
VLEQILAPVRKDYDYVVVDTPPSLGLQPLVKAGFPVSRRPRPLAVFLAPSVGLSVTEKM